MSQLSAVDLFRQAMTASRAGDRAKTRECLRQAVALDPNSETTWQWLAGVLDNPLEAIQAWEKVLALNPKNEKAKLMIRPIRLQAGIDAAKAKDIPTAKRLLRAVVADEPKNEHGWLWLASVCESATEAKAHLERVLYLNPNSKAAKKGIEYYEGKIAKQASGRFPQPVVNDQTSTTVTPAATGSTARPKADHDTPLEMEPLQRAAQLRTADQPGRVLVVDGSRTYRKVIGMALAFDHFTLIEAEDADEAIDRIREEGVPDLVIMDAKIMGLDPFEFCKLLRQHPDTETIPVFLMVGSNSPVDKFRSKNAGFTAVLSKPIRPESIIDTARKFCPCVAESVQ